MTGQDTDASGAVTIQIWECVASSKVAGLQSITCTVGSGFVVIGGGAADVWDAPEALLWESRPDSVNNRWIASSKDHLSSAAHQLHVYAIGLRLRKTDGTFMSTTELRSHIQYTSTTSSSGSNPSTSCTPSGKLLIGGGARANWTGVGQLLTQSYPLNGSWIAASKDHLQADPATVTAYCVGIDSNISGFDTLIATYQSFGTASSGGSSTVSKTFSSTVGVVSCYAGSAFWDGHVGGRMLYRMSPADNNIRGWVTSSKDHIQASSGTTFADIITIRKQ